MWIPGMSNDIYWGIDPGWQSLGFSVEKNGVGNKFRFLVPSSFSSYTSLLDELVALSQNELPSFIFMERFVPYNNVLSGAGEETLMLIGAVRLWAEGNKIPVHMFRAIEWKSWLCKWLVRNRNFSNPSTSFDKKFSIAAAKCLLDQLEPGSRITDHEADAICLSNMYRRFSK